MVRRKAAKAKKPPPSAANGRNDTDDTTPAVVKDEPVDNKPGAEKAEDPVAEPPPAVDTEPDNGSSSPLDTKIRVVGLTDLTSPQPSRGQTAGNSVVKNNVSRKTKLGTMQAIYKALKRVDEGDEEDAGDCSEDEDEALVESATPPSDNHMHFMAGDSCEEPVLKKGKYDHSAWSDEPVSVENVKNPDWSSVKRYPAFLGDPSSCTTALSFFSLFFDDVLIDQIVTHTNEEIRRKNTDDVQGAIGVTNPVELRAIIGLLLMNGLMRKTPLNLLDMFSDAYGPPIFKATMNKAKLEFIIRMMRFDDKETREERKKVDKFAAFRDFWDIFCGNCAKWYSPSEYLTVGDCFLEYRGKCPFKIHIDQKLRYGMRLISLCDARTFYFCGGIPYLGKDFLVDGGERIQTQYVVELSELIQEPERNITMEEWFTSIELAEALSERRFTMVGPIKTDDDIPFKMHSKTPLTEPRFAYQPDKTMVAFNLNNKNAVFLSTLHKTGGLNAQTGRPDIYELYEMTRKGLEIIDRNCESFSTRKPTGRWPMRFFFRALDLAVHNSYILYQISTNTTCRRSDFVKRLALALTEPLMQQRMYNVKLSKILRQNVCQVLGVEPRKYVMDLAMEKEAASPSPFSGRRRCWFCDSKKDRKTSKACSFCNLPICSMHTVSVTQCQLCAEKTNKTEDVLEAT